MYHDAYGERTQARELFRELPAVARRFAQTDFSAAARACPHGLDIEAQMRRAAAVLA
jgi:hypothetical protein